MMPSRLIIAFASALALFSLNGCGNPDWFADRLPETELSNDPAAQRMIRNIRKLSGWGYLDVGIVDASTGQPIPGRVFIRNYETVPGSDAVFAGWHSINGRRTIRAAAGNVTLLAQRSPYQPLTIADVDLTPGDTLRVTIPLSRDQNAEPSERGGLLVAIWEQDPAPVRLIPPLSVAIRNGGRLAVPAPASGFRGYLDPPGIIASMRAEGADASAAGSARYPYSVPDSMAAQTDTRPYALSLNMDIIDATPLWGRAAILYNGDTVANTDGASVRSPERYRVDPANPFDVFLDARHDKAFSILYDIAGDTIRVPDGVVSEFGSAKWLPTLLAAGRTFDAVGLSATVADMSVPHTMTLPNAPDKQNVKIESNGIDAIPSDIGRIVRCGTESERAIWFAILNAGFRCPAAGMERQPLFSERLARAWTLACPAPDDSPAPTRSWTSRKLLDTMRSGRISVTTGPAAYLSSVQRPVYPGAVLPADGRLVTLLIDISAARRPNRYIRYVELIRNGRVVMRHVNRQRLDTLSDFQIPIRETANAWYSVHVVESGPDAGECFTGPFYFRGIGAEMEPEKTQALACGIVTTPTGAPLSGAKVVCIRGGKQYSRTITDNDGSYALPILPDARVGVIVDGYPIIETPAWIGYDAPLRPSRVSGNVVRTNAPALRAEQYTDFRRLAVPVRLSFRLNHTEPTASISPDVPPPASE